MFFEGFEGFKKIKNDEKNLKVEEIIELLKKYENEIGEIYIDEIEPNLIHINKENKHLVDILADTENIIIERKSELEELNKSNIDDSFETGKDLSVAQTDRIIEQIYDLINDYIKNDGIVSEHITSVKKILYMEEEKKALLWGAIPLEISTFTIKNEEGKILYKAKQNHINKLYSLKNVESRKEELSIKYEKSKENKFVIMKPPFEMMNIYQDSSSVKTILKGNAPKKELKVSADYTDNHYLVELNEIVIGAIDCLDPVIKNKYKIEINDIKEETLIIAVAIMTDIYNLENNNEKGLQ